METLVLENVRCFRDRLKLPIRPITILVGENSTGKSSLLALARAAHWMSHSGAVPDFNADPFFLGAWEQIAHYHGGQGKRAFRFTIGYAHEVATARANEAIAPRMVDVTGTFIERAGQPDLAEWRVMAGEYGVTTRVGEKEGSASVQYWTPDGGTEQLPLELGRRYAVSAHRILSHLYSNSKEAQFKGRDAVGELVERLVFHHHEDDYRAIAPIRSKPHRTYDPVRDIPGPEGAHVPMLLAELSWGDKERWENLKKQLQAFGTSAGLFGKIEVKRKGNKASDPFQIHVGGGKFTFNIMDVGYGISQVLPILVDALLGPKGSRFLLQQPEVHLHPRAQAELGSFICSLVREKQQRFVVETHSDYFIDRIRMEVRDSKLIPHKSIVILFFYRDGTHVVVDPIDIDSNGELVDPPEHFRTFFLNEQRRFLGA